MIIEEWHRFSNLGSRPILQSRTIPYYVNDALSQPAYVDAGSYLIHIMLEDEIIRPIKNGYAFVRMTPAKRDHMNRIPRAVNALFNIYRQVKENDESFRDISDTGRCQIALVSTVSESPRHVYRTCYLHLASLLLFTHLFHYLMVLGHVHGRESVSCWSCVL